MIENEQLGLTLVRKERSYKVRDKLEPYVHDYLKYDNYTYLDASKAPVDGTDPRTREPIIEQVRIWKEVNKARQQREF